MVFSVNFSKFFGDRLLFRRLSRLENLENSQKMTLKDHLQQCQNEMIDRQTSQLL